jgi:hypothetical protein
MSLSLNLILKSCPSLITENLRRGLTGSKGALTALIRSVLFMSESPQFLHLTLVSVKSKQPQVVDTGEGVERKIGSTRVGVKSIETKNGVHSLLER